MVEGVEKWGGGGEIYEEGVDSMGEVGLPDNDVELVVCSEIGMEIMFVFMEEVVERGEECPLGFWKEWVFIIGLLFLLVVVVVVIEIESFEGMVGDFTWIVCGFVRETPKGDGILLLNDVPLGFMDETILSCGGCCCCCCCWLTEFNDFDIMTDPSSKMYKKRLCLVVAEVVLDVWLEVATQ